MHRILEQVCAIAAPERPGTVPDHLPALGPVVGSAHFLGWFGSSWDENGESIEMLLMDGLDGEYDFFRRILLLG